MYCLFPTRSPAVGAPSPRARARIQTLDCNYTPSEGVRGLDRVALNARSDRPIASAAVAVPPYIVKMVNKQPIETLISYKFKR
eukprot:1893283-Pleurochrysis_carterae.AAC.1